MKEIVYIVTPHETEQVARFDTLEEVVDYVCRLKYKNQETRLMRESVESVLKKKEPGILVSFGEFEVVKAERITRNLVDFNFTPKVTGNGARALLHAKAPDGKHFVLAIRNTPREPFVIWEVNDEGDCLNPIGIGTFSRAFRMFVDLTELASVNAEHICPQPFATQYMFFQRHEGNIIYSPATGVDSEGHSPSHRSFRHIEEAIECWNKTKWEGISKDDCPILCRVEVLPLERMTL